MQSIILAAIRKFFPDAPTYLYMKFFAQCHIAAIKQRVQVRAHEYAIANFVWAVLGVRLYVSSLKNGKGFLASNCTFARVFVHDHNSKAPLTKSR